MKLKTKIVSYVSAALLGLVVAIAIIVFWGIQPNRLRKLERSTMIKVAAGLSYEVGTEIQTDNSTRFNNMSRRLLQLEDVYGLAVYDRLGRLQFSSEFKKILSPELTEGTYQRVYQEQQPLFRQEQIDGETVHNLFYPIQLEDEKVLGALQLSFNFSSLKQYRKESLSASLLACTIGLIILVILVYSLLSGLFSRIRAVITKMNTIIREQDLTQRVVVRSSDEIGELGAVFNRMVDHLLQLTRETQNAGLRVTDSTEKIVTVARSQLESAENLSVSAAETNSGVEDLKELADQIAQKTGTVLANAEHSLQNTVKGVELVEELVTEMNEVDQITQEGVQQINDLIEKAQQITEIVTIIEEMTANTKLIAFNATIEAARAGEAGKGFSVVASEIRTLADNVAVATANIRKIIQDMQEATTLSAEIESRERAKVGQGLQSVKRSKEHLDMVFRMLDDTVSHAREIARATDRQKTATGNLQGTMHEFFQIAQTAKGSSVKTSASAKELDRLAEGMLRSVERFKLE